MSFSSDPGDWYGFLIWTCLSVQILNLFRTLSSWGSGNYRPSAPFLYEVASHVKNCHSGNYYYYYIIISPNRLNCRYLQLNWRYLQINCRYLQVLSIWRYLQLNCRYLQFGKSDKISAPRRNNRCAMIQVSGLTKSCIYKYFIINYIANNYNFRHNRKRSYFLHWPCHNVV